MYPIIQPARLKLVLPFKHSLYQASHHSEWIELITQYPDTPGAFELSTHTFNLPYLDGPVHAFSFYGILCSVLLRASGDIHRLITNSDLRSVTKHHHIPWEICRLDRRAIITVPLLTQIISLYENTLRESNPNCIVIWHCICILISVDINVLARAAGQDGPEIMKTTRQGLIDWTNTSASRRACIHSAQIFRILSHRKPADGTAFQSVRALFMSALVLGLYILVKPPSFDPDNENAPFDLSEANIDWKSIGEEGFSQASENAGSDDAAIRFIQSGGPIVLNGKKYECGVRHAKRIILEFAGLLDEIGSHWMDDYAQLLYVIHDTIE